MKQNKTFQTFQKIPREELKSLDRFVHSPYFNMHKGVIQLFELLLPYYPDFKSKHIEKPQLFKKIFPGEKYSYQRISDLMSYLTKVIEHFMQQQNFEKNELLKEQMQVSALRHYGLQRRFQKAQSKAFEKANHEAFARELHWHRYRLEDEADQYFTAQDSRTTDKSIERKTRQLDRFYLSAKLKNACEMLNRQNIVKENFEIDFLEETIKYVQQNLAQYKDSPDIAIYYFILMTLREPEKEQYYQKLRQLLKENTDVIHPAELRSMYDYAQNYCIKKINQGQVKYLNEIFELYKELLQEELLFEAGLLSEWDYKNIVTVGTRLKAYRWTEQFIEKYKAQLPEKTRENAYHYNLAALYYSESQYDKAMRLLQSVAFTDVYYNLGGRCLLLKSYYESGELEPLYSLIEAFKIYLRRSKLVSAYQCTAHMNLVKFTKKLADIKMMEFSSRKSTVQKQVEKLKKRMDKQSNISNANWLREQVDKIGAGLED